MKRYPVLSIPFFLVCGLAFVLSALGSRAEAQMSAGMPMGHGSTGNPGVLPPNSSAFGKTYGEWSAEWWQWLYSLPADQNPLFETADCSEGQRGRVWFLGGTFALIEEEPNVIIGEAVRDCSVPPGTALFFPVINAECNDLVSIPEGNEEQLRACAIDTAGHIETESLEATIDGREIQNLDRYRIESPFFAFGPLPDGNILGVEAGSTGNSVGDGYFLMIAPLSKGEHIINFRGQAVFTEEEDGFDLIFALDIEYHIFVEG